MPDLQTNAGACTLAEKVASEERSERGNRLPVVYVAGFICASGIGLFWGALAASDGAALQHGGGLAGRQTLATAAPVLKAELGKQFILGRKRGG